MRSKGNPASTLVLSLSMRLPPRAVGISEGSGPNGGRRSDGLGGVNDKWLQPRLLINTRMQWVYAKEWKYMIS